MSEVPSNYIVYNLIISDTLKRNRSIEICLIKK